MDMKQIALETLMTSLDKLKASMDEGPGGNPATLNPSEACLIYRTLTEVYGVQHRQSLDALLNGEGNLRG
jgi:hypothetical protein